MRGSDIRNRGSLLLTLAAAGLLAGCGGGSGSGSASGPSGKPAPATAGTAITISNFMFSPSPLKVAVGKPVTVTNEDSAVHTIKATNGAFDSKDLAKGKTYTFTIDKPGTYSYVCDIHQFMKGSVTAS